MASKQETLFSFSVSDKLELSGSISIDPLLRFCKYRSKSSEGLSPPRFSKKRGSTLNPGLDSKPFVFTDRILILP